MNKWNRKHYLKFIINKLGNKDANIKEILVRCHISQLRNYADSLMGKTPFLFEKEKEQT